MKHIKKKIKQIMSIRLCIDVNKIKSKSILTIDLDMDSLDGEELLQALEREFDIYLGYAPFNDLDTVKDLIDLVKVELKKK